MRKFVAYLILYFIKFALWFRYRVQYKGLDKLNRQRLNKPGGVLFLPNHPTVFVDPSLVVIGVYRKYPIRPLIVEYMYYATGIHALMKFMRAIPIPNLNSSTNSLKRRRSERAFHEVIKGLRNGENFLIYPAGRVKLTNYEMIGGASGVHSILQESPEANVVLVKITGLYGSQFSTALTGKFPGIFPTIFQGIKTALKNGLFFMPRRNVTIEYVPVPYDFPRNANRLTFNKYLEHWYNRPDGLDPSLNDRALPGESLHLVPLSRWSAELPKVLPRTTETESYDLHKIPVDVQTKVIDKLAHMTDFKVAAIRPDMHLSSDLGLDSLDASEIFIFLQDTFGVTGVPPRELTTVGRLMAIAAKQVHFTAAEEEVEKDMANWFATVPAGKPGIISAGETIPEVFLNRCRESSSRAAVADLMAGVVTYDKLKLRVLVLAEYIRRLPGKHIGIMLPASVAASAVIIATQLAGKIPVMINWTVGARHLESVVELSKIEHVLSSWAFVDRLENIELDSLEDRLLFLEDVRRDLGIGDKIKAAFLSKLSTKRILKAFDMDKRKGSDCAVVLFTSGTESMPKGVPLSHTNVLENQRRSLELLTIYENDVLLNILPPFHSFGFTVTGLMGILAGLRTACYPNPTDGPRIAKSLQRWGATIICGAPTFLRAALKAATPEDMATMRLVVSGAEKVPPELFTLLRKFGKENCFAEGYGITECSPILTVLPSGKPRIGVGTAIRGIELLIVHPETLKPMEAGEQGLLLARGPTIFEGYLNPGLASPFLEVNGESWYRTGDLGFLDAEGHLTITGRLKRFVKLGGEMISLVAIESALLEAAPKKGWELSEDAPSLAVISQEIDENKVRIILITSFQTTVDEANTALRMVGFSNLVKVSEVKPHAEIPLMGTGKINYRELEARHAAVAEK